MELYKKEEDQPRRGCCRMVIPDPGVLPRSKKVLSSPSEDAARAFFGWGIKGSSGRRFRSPCSTCSGLSPWDPTIRTGWSGTVSTSRALADHMWADLCSQMKLTRPAAGPPQKMISTEME